MEHGNGWCFRGIYKGGLWEDDLHVSTLLIQVVIQVSKYVTHIIGEPKYKYGQQEQVTVRNQIRNIAL